MILLGSKYYRNCKYPKLSVEKEEGNIEYKIHLVEPSGIYLLFNRVKN